MEMLPRKDIVRMALAQLPITVAGPITETTEEIKCHCPYHRDRNPSMYINLKTGLFHCFQCGAGGMIETLTKDLTGTPLHTLLNIKNDEFASYAQQFVYTEIDSGTLTSLDHISITMHGDIRPIETSGMAVSYLRNRGILLRVANDMGMKVAVNAAINGTRFINRLLIPVEEGGKLISVEGRDLTRNSSPKVLYPKGSTVNSLFQMDRLDRTKPLYVVEGVMDLAILRSHSQFANSTSMFGANITHRQTILLKEFEHIIVIPDNDDAGRNMVDTLRSRISGRVEVLPVPRVLRDQKIKDVGDIVEKGRISIDALLQQKWLKYIRPVQLTN